MPTYHKSQRSTFPAMEELIGRMPQNDLLILSGFFISLHEHANALVRATSALAENDTHSGVRHQTFLKIAQDSGQLILKTTNDVSQTIENRLLDSGRLRRAFPRILI